MSRPERPTSLPNDPDTTTLLLSELSLFEEISEPEPEEEPDVEPDETEEELTDAELRELEDSLELNAFFPLFDELEVHKLIDEDDPVGYYFAEAGRYPLLTKEQELELGRRMMAGDTEARDRLINSNLRLVLYVASRYANPLSPFYLDLVQAGNIGLVRGTPRYDYRRGFRFSTYLYKAISSFIDRENKKRGRLIHVPSSQLDTLRFTRKIEDELEADLGRKPTPKEVITTAKERRKNLRLDENLFRDIKRTGLEMSFSDINTTEDEDDDFLEWIEAADDTGESSDLAIEKQALRDGLALLDPADRLLLEIKYGLQAFDPYTLENYLKTEGINRQTFYLRLNRAHNRLQRTAPMMALRKKLHQAR